MQRDIPLDSTHFDLYCGEFFSPSLQVNLKGKFVWFVAQFVLFNCNHIFIIGHFVCHRVCRRRVIVAEL
jgi:hypothetical protein